MKRKKPKRWHLELYLAVYRLTVIVAWEVSYITILNLARRRGVTVTPEKFGKDLLKIHESKATGYCLELGDDNDDVLVYLRHLPKKSYDYGTLYHELFHAVQFIMRSRNMKDELESPAYLYEHLATQCNKYFWARR